MTKSKSVPREEICRRCAPAIDILKMQGKRTATSGEIVQVLKENGWPRIFVMWLPGKTLSFDGIAKSIGDALGENINGLYLPCYGNPKVFELDKIEIINGMPVPKK